VIALGRKAGKQQVDKVTKAKRIYEISLLLRRKPVSYILEYIKQNYKLERGQAYNYIKAAREEWKKYFEKLKGDGITYHITQFRDLKDKALDSSDYKLAFDIAKEEAKLMGIYPAEKHKLDLPENFEITVKLPKDEDDNN
jgi:hypothetical protein